MTSATDNRTTGLQGILDEFEHECFMLRTEASETRARGDVVRKSYERIRDEFAGRIAAALSEPIITCRDCRRATISTTGVCKYCEMFVLPDADGYGADPQVNLPLDFFCGFAERKEVD